MGVFVGDPVRRSTASHDNPHARASAGATRQPLRQAIARPMIATTTRTVTPIALAASSQDGGTTVVNHAAVLATVARVTQPRCSPVTPSISTESTTPPRGSRVTTAVRKAQPSAASSSTITTTVRNSVPKRAATSHSPFRTIVTAIGQPIARWRSETRWRGSACQIAYAIRPR